MRRQLLPALRMVVLFTVVLGLAYPLLITAVAQVAMPAQADGSIVTVDGVPVGSSLIGQNFSEPISFHPRPSAAGDGYDGMASSGSNLGPLNDDLLATVAERVAAYREENGLGDDVKVPVDAVTASGSGLDPHISIANARLQAPRVAAERGVPIQVVLDLVGAHTDGRSLGILGDPGVNVLELNLALDAQP